LEFVLFRPQCAHLGQGVTFNHGKLVLCQSTDFSRDLAI
jgi:hypothetical protein